MTRSERQRGSGSPHSIAVPKEYRAHASAALDRSSGWPSRNSVQTCLSERGRAADDEQVSELGFAVRCAMGRLHELDGFQLFSGLAAVIAAPIMLALGAPAG